MGNAINGTGYGLTVLPFYDGFWGGVWSGASYSSGTGLTTFTGNFGTPVGGGALGDSVKPGMVVIPDLHRAVPLHIESVNIDLLGSDTLTVKGDATGLGGSGTRFRIHQHAPYKYDLTDEVKRNTPCDLGARYLWSSYRRIPWTWSRAGEDPYLAWNRVYLPEIGRWTSTDPLASPWVGLFAYAMAAPANLADATGLDSPDKKYDSEADKTSVKQNCGKLTWYINRSATVGISASIWYEPEAACCSCSCRTLAFIQFTKKTITDKAGKTVGLNEAGELKKNQHREDGDAATSSHDWQVDRYKSDSSSFYNANVAPGGGLVSNSRGNLGKCGEPKWGSTSPRTKTSMIDTPSYSGAFGWGSIKNEYIACAVCVESGALLACVKYGWTVGPSKKNPGMGSVTDLAVPKGMDGLGAMAELGGTAVLSAMYQHEKKENKSDLAPVYMTNNEKKPN